MNTNPNHMDLHKIDFNLLKVFKLLLEERQVSRAARRLNLSQPAVSHALRRLRDLFDDPLFVAEGRTMHPTPKARVLAETVNQVWHTLELGLTHLQPFTPANSNHTFRIAVSSSIEYTMVPRIYNMLKQAGTGLDLEAIELTEQDYWQTLGQGHLDLVVGFGQGLHLHPKLTCISWFHDPLCCLSNTAIEFTKGDLTREELISHSHIYTSSWGHSQALVETWLQQQGLRRNIAIRVPSFMAVVPLLMDHPYQAVVPYTIGKLLTNYGEIQMHNLPQELRADYCLAWHPLYQQEPALNWFIEQLKKLT